jgi:hypothetical protein
MKKLFALLMVCGFALAFVACGGKKAETTTEDSTKVAAPDTTAAPAADTTKTDTTAAK